MRRKVMRKKKEKKKELKKELKKKKEVWLLILRKPRNKGMKFGRIYVFGILLGVNQFVIIFNVNYLLNGSNVI